jgi:hypothetical protein
MPIDLFDLARNLKITRFTIDVLTQRLERLELPRDSTSDECTRFVGLTHESVAACDQLHDALHEKFSGVQSLDSGAIAFLNAGFLELHRPPPSQKEEKSQPRNFCRPRRQTALWYTLDEDQRMEREVRNCPPKRVRSSARLDGDDGGELDAAHSVSPQGGSLARRSDLC